MRCPFLLPPLAALVVATAGCGPRDPAMTLTAVSPASGWNGSTTAIVIAGNGFYPSVTMSAGGAETSLDGGHRVELLRDGEPVVALGGVDLLDPTQIRAVVPSGLEIGRYDIAVQGPTGAPVVLPGAFSVKSTRAQSLALTPVDPAPFWIVDEVATFDASAFDIDGAPLSEPLPVRLSLKSVDGKPIVAGFSDGILLDQVADRSSDGAAIVGRLRLDGTARIPISVATPSTVQLSLTALEPDIDGATVNMSWYASADYHLAVELPFPTFEAVAGREFVVRVSVLDRDGAVVPEPVYPVHARLSDSCGEVVVDLSNIQGAVQVPVTLLTATGPHGCAPLESLIVTHRDQTASSQPFRVQPDRPNRLEVEVPEPVLFAGDAYTAVVRSVDVYGNRTPYPGDGALVSLSDTSGDVQTTGCLHDPRRGEVDCTFVPTVADPTVLMIARDPSAGLVGASLPYAVRAGPLAQLQIGVSSSGPTTAGDPVATRVDLQDAFGNAFDRRVFPLSDFHVREMTGAPVDCMPIAHSISHIDLECYVTAADAAATLTVTGPLALEGTSNAFEVTNAELAGVVIDVDTIIPTAGEVVNVEMLGVDRFDNPYLVQSSARIDLADALGDAPTTALLFNDDGRATAALVLTTAGTNHLLASRGGDPLGTSEPLTVLPADPVLLTVEPERPWVWVDEPVTVELRAKDRFGNVANTNEGVDLRSVQGTFAGAGATLVAGRATVQVVPRRAVALDDWTAESISGLTGEALDLPVLEDCGTDAPRASLSLDGGSDVVACLDDDGVDVRATVSSAGDPVDRYGLWVPGRARWIGEASAFDLEFSDVGAFRVVALTAEGTCGTQVERAVFIGDDDGSPTGPIPLVLAASSLRVDQDTTDLSIGPVLDCAGEPAEDGEVYLRTDRGLITGATSSGSGLFVSLDADGNADATLDLTKALDGGQGRIVAWVENDAARGGRSFVATGDLVRPKVIRQHPEGAVAGSFGSIVLTFTEPPDTDSFDPQVFKVIGPSAVAVAEVLQPRPSQVELVLSAPVSASAGRWTVQVRDTLTDLAGNTLAGTWETSAADYEADFGALSTTVARITSCTASQARFRPDGDDGDGADADEVTLSLAASATPDTWRIAVIGPDGVPVRHARVSGASSADTWTWDGRDDTERIVSGGRYSLETTPHNADGTPGIPCSVAIDVEHEREW